MVKSYFSLDRIGASEERVPVTFTTPSFSLGRDVAVRSPEGETVAEVAAGCTATLSLWVAAALRQGGYATVQLPARYTIAAFREFKTDPLAASLHAKSPHFYAAGLTLCALVGNPTATGHMSAEGSRLAAQIVRLYQLRYMKIIRSAAKKGFDLHDEREKLTEGERRLLDSCLKGQAEERLWYASPL